MGIPERPHPAPCRLDCADCIEWARAVVAIPTQKRERPVSSAVAEAMPLEDYCASIMAIASRATGLSVDELKRRGAEMPTPTLEELRPVERVARDVVAARGVPEKHLQAVYDHEPLPCDAFTAVRAFVSGSSTMLVLSGGVGVRKTGSSCWALTQRAGTFVKADELLRVAASKDADDVMLYKRCRGTPFLVVDDLGGEYVDDKGWAVKVLNSVLDFRYEHKLKTIITTNLDAQTFKATYQERIADRLRESGRFVSLGGVSVRRRA